MSTSPSPRNSVAVRSTTVIIALLVMAELVAAFESSTVFLALPRLGEVFGATPAETQWVATSYMLMAAACVVLTGRLGDIYGRKRVLVIIMVLSVVGSFISAFSPNLGWVIAGRALQGIAAATLPLCIGIARDLLPKGKVAMGVAAISASALLSGSLGMAVSGVLIESADWQWIFIVAGLGGVVVVAVVQAVLPRDTHLDSGAQPDWIGAILMPLGITLALIAVSSGNSLGWTSGFVLISGALGALLLVAWWVWQLKAPSPLFDVRLLKRRDLGFSYLICIGVALGALGLAVVTPTLLQTPAEAPVGFGLSPSAAGAIGSVGGLLGAFAAFGSGAVTSRLGAERTVQVSSISLLIGVAGMGLCLHWLPGFVAGSIIQSIGVGLAFAGISNYLVSSSAAEQTGQVTGFSSMMRTSFNAVSTGVLGTIMAIGLVAGTPFSSEGSYIVIFIGCSAFLALAVILSLLLPRRTMGGAPEGNASQSAVSPPVAGHSAAAAIPAAARE